jgi:hypothetical protein
MFGAWKKLSVSCLDFQGGRVQVGSVNQWKMNPVKLTSLLLIVSALMGFGCATSNQTTMLPWVEEDKNPQTSGANAPWQWQVLYDFLSLGGGVAAGQNH